MVKHMKEPGYWINVPQGRGARLIRDVDWLQLQGLYTDAFSICSLMAAMGKNRISLMHLDKQFSVMNADDPQCITRLHSVLSELNWVKQDDSECRVVIVHKEGNIIEGMPIGTARYNAQLFKKYFKIHGFEIELQCVEDLQLGITVNFNDGLQPYPREPIPHNLLCHPDEYKFNTAHQIEEGFYHLGPHESVIKQLVIFDGFFWQRIDDKEISLQLKSKVAQYFIDMIQPSMTTADMHRIFSKQYNVTFSGAVETIKFPSEMALSIGPGISLHKNGFDVARCHKLNLDQYILELEKQIKTVNGRATKKVILTAVKNPTTAYHMIYQVVEDILKVSTSVSIKIYCKFLLRWASFYTMYEGKMTNVRQYPEWQQRAHKFMTTATKHLQEKQYQAAINLYQSCLPLLVYTSTEEKEDLLTVTMNLAKCYYELQNFPSALRHLNIAIALTEKHPQKNSEVLDQLLKMLNASNQALQSETSVELGSDLQLPKSNV